MPEPTAATLATLDRARDVAFTALDRLRPLLLEASGQISQEAKGDGTPVTEADRDADDLLSSALTDAFPTHGMLSEERATVSPDTEWTWIVDPIDGTANFICGLPYWCVSVALAHQGQPVLGVVDVPVLARRYVAITGRGAWSDGTPLKVRARADWRDGRNRHIPVMLSTSVARRARAAGLRMNPRVMGAVALDLALVAQGAAIASVAQVPHVWDVAAGQLLVTEAGGAVRSMSGDPLLPLRPGVEFARRTAVFAAGPDADYVDDLAGALLARQ